MCVKWDKKNATSFYQNIRIILPLSFACSSWVNLTPRHILQSIPVYVYSIRSRTWSSSLAKKSQVSLATKVHGHSNWTLLDNNYPHMCIHASIIDLGRRCKIVFLVAWNLSKDKLKIFYVNQKSNLPSKTKWQQSREKQNYHKNITNHLISKGL